MGLMCGSMWVNEKTAPDCSSSQQPESGACKSPLYVTLGKHVSMLSHMFRSELWKSYKDTAITPQTLPRR